jgi:peptidoglycan/xylan/chitin deacetylase (PgdA/CDA1 family)
MRPSILFGKIATRAAWPVTRCDRGTAPLAPPVLCYHRVLPRLGNDKQQPAYSVTPAQFRAQMSVLAGEGFTSLTLQEFSEAMRGSRALPPRSTLITFDDGYSDNYSIAWPIAREFGMKLNLFICTGLVEGQSIRVLDRRTISEKRSEKKYPDLWQPIQWSQLREMRAAGVNVEFHSHSHENLGKMRAEDIAADAATGISLLKQHLGFTPRYFAFPFGHHGSYPHVATALLAEQGIEMFFTTELGRTAAEDKQTTFSRIVIHAEDDLDSFRRKIYGGYDWIGTIRKLNYSVRGWLSSGGI